MAAAANDVMTTDQLTEIADKGYYKGEEIVASDETGISVVVPKPMTSNAAARGQFDKADFAYDVGADVYICPAGEKLTNRFTSQQDGKEMKSYASGACAGCVPLIDCFAINCRATDQSQMHDEQRPPSTPVGERGYPRSGARTLGQRSDPTGGPQHDRRASLRHHQIMDGGHALQNANSEKGGDGDGAACPRLQYDPRHEHHGRSSDNRGHEGVRGFVCPEIGAWNAGSVTNGYPWPNGPSKQSK